MPRQPNSSPQTLRLIRALVESTNDWRYGYDLSRETSLKSGTLYPILVRLEAQGWLETRWEDPGYAGRPPRHLYRLTGTGEKAGRALLSASKPQRLPMTASRTLEADGQP